MATSPKPKVFEEQHITSSIPKSMGAQVILPNISRSALPSALMQAEPRRLSPQPAPVSAGPKNVPPGRNSARQRGDD